MRPARNREPGADFSPDLSRLLDLVSNFSRQTIVVLGDFVADEFVTGQISRVSREAPVLILQRRESRLVPGGGANAANNLADLGACVLAVGAVGDDAAGRALVDYFRRKGVDTSAILCVPGWTTATKTRFLAGWTHTARQQVLRVDSVPKAALPENARAKLARLARERLRGTGVLLVSDYGVGAVTPEMACRIPAKLSTLDSRYRLLDYRRARLTSATPNEPELESLYHSPIGNDDATLRLFATRTLERLALRALLVTRGKDGMVLFERGRRPHPIVAHGTEEAVDVTGAGDTVIAVFTLALAAGATFAEAAHLANYAASIVVMKRGTATVTRAELEAVLRREATSRS